MSIVLDGTTGITTPGLTNTGTETLVNLTTTGNTTLGDASTDTLNVGNGGLIKDASGNVGVGVTPSAWTNYKAIQLGGGSLSSYSDNNYIELSQNGYYASGAYKYVNTGYASKYQQNTGTHQWYVAASGSANATISFTQAMTLDASGNLLVGTTSSNGQLSIAGSSSFGSASSNSAYGIVVCAATNSSGSAVLFRHEKSSSSVGSITTTASATAYNTSSDYRLKNITGPLTGAKDFIMALKPKQGTWKVDGSAFVGFLAHEFQEVSPSSVSGEKDAVDVDGKPIMQAMQASSSEVMANLVAFIQEQQTLITTLTDRIAALEAR